MKEESMVRERRERIDLTCLQGLVSGPNLNPNATNEELGQEEICKGIVELSCMLADEFIRKMDSVGQEDR
jgi:hypothetical protein